MGAYVGDASVQKTNLAFKDFQNFIYIFFYQQINK